VASGPLYILLMKGSRMGNGNGNGKGNGIVKITSGGEGSQSGGKSKGSKRNGTWRANWSC